MCSFIPSIINIIFSNSHSVLEETKLVTKVRMASFLTPGPPAQFTQLDVLESAGRQIDKQLQDDKNYLEFSDQLKVPIHSKSCGKST